MKSQGAGGYPPAGLILCDLEQFLSTSIKPDPTGPLTRGLHWPNPGRCGRRKNKDRPKYLQGPETIWGGQLRTLFLKEQKLYNIRIHSVQCNFSIILNCSTHVRNPLYHHEAVCVRQGGIFPLDKLSLGLEFTGNLILMAIMFALVLILTEDDHLHFIDMETGSEKRSDSPGSAGQGARF